MSSDNKDKDITRIGNDEQTRNVDGVTLYLTFRPVTKDFEWAFYQKKVFKISGVEPTIDKCVRAARQYIKHIDHKSGETL